MALRSRFSRSTTGAGVPAGARIPNHPITSKPGSTVSATVGTSGNAVERCLDVTARARSLPDLTWPIDPETVSKTKSISPPMSAVSAGPDPL